ncbi:Ku protein [Fodinicola acaciae]|uniref:non-homologous end joining protein Ku n=1 Tax=Fodinicola acaciae TaxID=2681555 RepID=UPI0013D12A74|nr:Ku protein [Fodinicola acaciae]
MPRPIWSGSISFGLVTIPVALFTATEDHTVHFHQYERDSTDRIRYQRVNERTGQEVDYADIVKGREVGGRLVQLEQQELDDIAPGRSRSLEIDTFVDLADIDPIYFQKTYWLAPAGEDSERPYFLLLEAMSRTGKAGVALFVMRGKQYLTVIRPDRDVLALDTLFFADEIRDPADVVENAPKKRGGKDLDMAERLVESMSGEWKPEDFRDTYTEKVNALIRDKAKGRKAKVADEPPEPTEAVDLLEALRASVTRRKKKSATAAVSKKELMETAKELDIPGRSKMSREELEKAVRKAS